MEILMLVLAFPSLYLFAVSIISISLEKLTFYSSANEKTIMHLFASNENNVSSVQKLKRPKVFLIINVY